MNYISDTQLKINNCYNVIIEIPKGTNKKYELEDKVFDKVLCVRRVKGKYPFYYGCFPQTYAGDKDPLDMVLLSNKNRDILSIVEVEPIGVIKTLDNNEIDDKIFVIAKDEEIKNKDKLIKKAIKFLYSYKGKKANTIIDPIFYGKEEAIKLINAANKAFSPNNSLKSF